MFRRKCKHCGKPIVTNRRHQKFCNKQCRLEYEEIQKEYRTDNGRGQMCWICKNACSCSWANGIPVDRWKAVKTSVKHKGKLEYYSYRIIFCPQFAQESDVKIVNTRR